uniref:Uncharacterized protein n=2 Tax=Ixodes scapularis TaxID=6945 RepID=A0A1S4M2F8_IXOSC
SHSVRDSLASGTRQYRGTSHVLLCLSQHPVPDDRTTQRLAMATASLVTGTRLSDGPRGRTLVEVGAKRTGQRSRVSPKSLRHQDRNRFGRTVPNALPSPNEVSSFLGAVISGKEAAPNLKEPPA